MSESPLMIKSKAFALEVIRACKVLREAKCEGALINLFLRSGTSIGANIREAFYAHGKADFVAKLHIALKECSETEYWLELLIESGYYHDETILDRCVEVKRMLIASINTAKGECKMNTDVIEKARQQFVKASKEFNFTFISPYPLDEDTNLYAFGFIDGYASKNGAIIALVEPPQYEADQNVIEWCKNHNRWFSQINIEPLLGEYDRSYFQELLDDWKI